MVKVASKPMTWQEMELLLQPFAEAIVKKDWKTLLQEQINGFETWIDKAVQAIMWQNNQSCGVQTQTK
jgi:hypothetical protein